MKPGPDSRASLLPTAILPSLVLQSSDWPHDSQGYNQILPFGHYSGSLVRWHCSHFGCGHPETPELLTRNIWARLFRNYLLRALFLLIQVQLQGHSFSLHSSCFQKHVLCGLSRGFRSTHSHPLFNVQMLSTRSACFKSPRLLSSIR